MEPSAATCAVSLSSGPWHLLSFQASILGVWTESCSAPSGKVGTGDLTVFEKKAPLGRNLHFQEAFNSGLLNKVFLGLLLPGRRKRKAPSPSAQGEGAAFAKSWGCWTEGYPSPWFPRSCSARGKLARFHAKPWLPSSAVLGALTCWAAGWMCPELSAKGQGGGTV